MMNGDNSKSKLRMAANDKGKYCSLKCTSGHKTDCKRLSQNHNMPLEKINEELLSLKFPSFAAMLSI